MFKFLHRRRIKQKLIQEDLLASSVFVNPILNQLRHTIPFSQYSIRPFSLAILCNEILLNQRKSYLEFGGGVSTILIAKFLQMNEIQTSITMVESDNDWLSLVGDKLAKEGLSELVTMIYAPLKEYETPFGVLNWYDKNTLSGQLKPGYDVVFVDGPPGKNSFHRYSALPFMIDQGLLNEHHAFYLDDAVRKQEKAIVAKWEEEFSLTFDNIIEQLAYYHQGESYKIRLTNN